MKTRLFIMFLCLPLILTGCWDTKEVQSINFVTAMGIDYVNNKYVVYGQILDFANLSKQEGPSESPQEAALIIGKGEGTTILGAMNQLYPSAQQQTLWTHVKAVVLSKSVIDSKLAEVFNGLFRSREMRYTAWVYGTEDEIGSILSSKALLNHSSMSTILFDPVRVYHQLSNIPPIQIIHLLKGVREPASVALLPSITSHNHTWKTGKEALALASLNGIYVISKGKNQGLVANEDRLAGARYISYRRFRQHPLEIADSSGETAVIYVTKPKPQIKMTYREGKIHTRLHLRIRGKINEVERSTGLSESKIQSLGEAKIKQQVIRTFESSKAKQIDLYGLEEMLYRTDYALWKKVHSSDSTSIIDKFELDEVVADLHIVHSNTYNLR